MRLSASETARADLPEAVGPRMTTRGGRGAALLGEEVDIASGHFTGESSGRTGLIVSPRGRRADLGAENCEVAQEKDEQGEHREEYCTQDLRTIRLHGAFA